MKETNYYQILNISRNATEEEIKRAYRQLALRYHPDRNPMSEEAEEKLKEINEAYAVLGDAEKRRTYDHYGYTGFRRQYPSKDIFNYRSECARNIRGNFFFNRGMGCGKRGRLWRGCSFHFSELNNFMVDENVIYGVDITPEEALYGTERIVIARTSWGDKSYRINIPAGTTDGTRIKFSLKEANHISSNLYIQINVKDFSK